MKRTRKEAAIVIDDQFEATIKSKKKKNNENMDLKGHLAWPNKMETDKDFLNHVRTVMIPTLMNFCQLVVRNQKGGKEAKFRIEELELYVKTDFGIFSDNYTHGSKDQEHFIQWYFHKTGGAFRGGSFKGLDIAIGNQNHPQGSITGGLLIRSLSRDRKEFVCGPSKCVDAILEAAGVTSILSLVKTQSYVSDSASDKTSLLHLAYEPTAQKPKEIYVSARVGLNLKSTKNAQSFCVRGLRFLTAPKEIKKGRNHFIVALFAAGMSTADICHITGARQKWVDAKRDIFQKGAKEKSLSKYENKIVSADDYVKMAGKLKKTILS